MYNIDIYYIILCLLSNYELVKNYQLLRYIKTRQFIILYTVGSSGLWVTCQVVHIQNIIRIYQFMYQLQQ